VQDITCLPQAPAHVKGVINLRGKAIPVVDLRLKFGLPEQHHCGPGAASIAHTPDFGDGTARPYLPGMAPVKGKVKILLEIDRCWPARIRTV
jgi:purine-binding chemotaxis protein CheW